MLAIDRLQDSCKAVDNFKPNPSNPASCPHLRQRRSECRYGQGLHSVLEESNIAIVSKI